MAGLVAALWTWTLPGDPAVFPANPGDPAVIIHVLDNGFHADIAAPRAALEAGGGPLAQAIRRLGPGDWVLIGWGDARFYVDQRPIHHRLPDGARAFFRPGNAAVVMLDPYPRDPAVAFDPADLHTVRLSPAGFARLRRRVEASLDLRDGAPRLASVRRGDDARFFASRERFWIGFLCNHWTARTLNAAGLPIRPLRAATSAEVVRTVDTAELDTGRPGA
jgi:hypothetical protein